MFDQILVPVDGSLLAENVIPHTIAMARVYGSEVTLISVLDPLGGNISTRPIDPWDWRIQRTEVEAYLKELSLPFQAAGLTVHTILLEGKAPDHVINYSSHKGANLIILSSHGQGGVSGWNTSSVVTKITQQARISVMIIRSYLPPEQKPEDLHYRRILVPLDGSQRAEFGLFAAAHLARAHEAGLLIAHVIKPPELPRRTPLSVQDYQLSEQVIESNRTEASRYLDALKATLDCKVDTCLLVGDSVAEALHTLVEQEEIDLIILNAHGFGGNPRWHFGNVAVNFLAYSTIPLLVVQDFSRDNLVEGQAESYSNDFQSQAPVVLNEAQNRY